MNLPNYTCSSCNMEFTAAKPVDLIDSAPQIGDLMLCGLCGKPNIVSLEGLRLMTEEEFSSLSEDEMKDLVFAQRAIQKKVRES